ncbi:hypothetical protein [Nocardioides sp.]|uniref:hypothetical protein n=1 Tax=Nocardioides sp. TaxID=35761 RepID=UPI003D0DCB23
MELTREQERWLFDLADELKAPFPVKIFSLTAIEELLLDAPNIREYYLGDGMEKVSQMLSQMGTLAGLQDVTADPTKVEPADATRSLDDLHRHINDADPHFNYDYEVTGAPPTITPGPGLIASVVARAGKDAPHVTWHISTKYDAALEDRPIPGTYTVHPGRMTDEQRKAWERWCKYGTPVVLTGDAIAEVTLDLPGGLSSAEPVSENVLKLGPAYGDFNDEPATRALWIIEDADGTKLAERAFDFRLAARGQAGGEHRRAMDADGYITLDLYTHVTSETGGTLEGDIHAHGERWVGQPVQRVLPAIRFCAAWGNDNKLMVQDEFALRAPALLRTLPGEPRISPVLLSVVEDLARISAATGRPIGLPEDVSLLSSGRGTIVRTIADVLTESETEIRVGDLVLWYEDHPGAFEDLEARAASGSLIVPWPAPFPLFGEGFEFKFIFEITERVTLEPAEPSEGQPATRRGARVLAADLIRGRLRLETEAEPEPEPPPQPLMEG